MAITPEQIVDIVVGQYQNSPLITSLPPEAKVILNQTIEEVARENARNILIKTEIESNRSIDEISGSLIGESNPVDIVNGNLPPAELSNVLNNKVGDRLVNATQDILLNEAFNRFKNKVPPIVGSLIDYNVLLNELGNIMKGSSTATVERALLGYSEKTLSGAVPVQQIVPEITSIFGRAENSTDALDQINRQFDNAATNKALNEAKAFNLKNADNEAKLVTQSQGFIDPTATHPTKEYAGKAETNKLAQGDVSGTIVQTKEKDRAKQNQLPNNDSWEQPPIPFKAEYPYNKTIETESGHIIELDDSPGGERIHVYHRSGTFVEIDANGSVVKRTKGSSYEIIDKNGYVSVTGDAHLTVKGSIKIFVGGDADIEVEGDTNIKCLNDITMQAAGRVDISATEELNLHSANVNIEADVNLNIKGDVNAFLTSKDIYLKSNNNFYSEAVGTHNIKSDGETYVEGSKVYFNSSKAETSKVAESSNIGLIGTRKDITKEKITDPIAPNYLDTYGFVAEDSVVPGEAEKQSNDLKEKGIASKDELNETAIEVESQTPSSGNTTLIRPDNSLLSQTYLPDNYQLSKHFTLGMLTTKTAVSSYALQPQLGLSYGQLAFNLSAISLNILEPLLALYPNMFVTSAFRSAEKSSTTSDHPRGKAVDIQFKGASKADYYDIANKLATQLNYDKLLLEYKTYGTGLPWIHISFDVDAPKKLVLTYFNDKKYKDGLVNLA